MNILIYRCTQVKSARTRLIVGSLIGLFLVVISVLPIISIREHFSLRQSSHKNTVSVAIISARTPELVPGLDLAPYQKQIANFVSSSIQNGAELVVLPEETGLLYPFSALKATDVLGSSSRAVIIDSGVLPVYGDEEFISGAPIRALADGQGGTSVVRDKIVLTPQGEYLPYLFREMLALIGAEKEKLNFDHSRTFVQGDVGTAAVLGQGASSVRTSLMFCLEVMMPDFGKRLVRTQGSQLLIVPSSDVWFQNSPSLIQDTLRWNQAQAVTAGVPLAQSANQAPAFVLDKYGRVLGEIKNAAGFQVVNLSL